MQFVLAITKGPMAGHVWGILERERRWIGLEEQAKGWKPVIYPGKEEAEAALKDLTNEYTVCIAARGEDDFEMRVPYNREKVGFAPKLLENHGSEQR